jgi:hypothetical protein
MISRYVEVFQNIPKYAQFGQNLVTNPLALFDMAPNEGAGSTA